MPRRVNPGTINTGPGKTVPGQQTELGLIGVAGAPDSPNIGEPGYVPPGGSVLRPGIPAEFPGLSGLSGALNLHIDDAKGAHQAAAISIDGFPTDLILGDDVESALDELSSSIPDAPTVGNWFAHRPLLSGIPDWGELKLEDWDVAMNYPGGPGTVYLNPGQGVYPFYWVPPTPTQDNEFQLTGPGYEIADFGQDPRDAFWNVAAVVGGGTGTTLAGGYTRGDLTIRTDRIYATPTPLIGPPGPAHKLACISGIVFPADRGVLALIHWPAAGAIADFQALDLLERCVAALLLGQGLLGESCFDLATAADNLCDGAPGGIFGKGEDADGDYDPFAYPGRATGQYNLNEIHRGVNAQSEGLKPPWDALGPAAGPGWPRVQNATYPGAGQVRLGTDDTADIGGFAPVQPYGIPILGARRSGYNPVPPLNFDNTTYRAIGYSLLEDSNFFRYRLPWLEDYSSATGLKYTPKGEDPRTSRETQRYFSTTTVHATAVATPNVFEVVDGVDKLLRAGDYRLSGDGTDPTGNKDYWNWQLARYRHTFALVGSDVATSEEIGTYILVHFKKEKDFEAFVRDGIMPWDANDPYSVYSAFVLDGTIPDALGNIINEITSGFAPDGPAPDFGYGGPAYHPIRANCRTTPQLEPQVDSPLATWEAAIPGDPVSVMWVSGIAYLIPWELTNSLRNINVTVAATALDLWAGAYRVDDNYLTGDVAPAQLASPCPVFLGAAPLSYQLNGADNLPNWIYTLNSPGAIADRHQRLQRVEFPFTALNDGVNAFGPNPGQAPQPGDVANFELLLELEGDRFVPSFSSDAVPRVFLRKPLSDVDHRVMPFSAPDGYGVRLDAGDDAILFHTTDHRPVSPGIYGNFLTGAIPSPSYPTLDTPTKDVEERFLDEVYRYLLDAPALFAHYGSNAAYLALFGPGKGAWHSGSIPIPVRPGTATDLWWVASSWVQEGRHEENLNLLAAVLGELQVAGMSDRNPPYSEDVTVPYPNCGILQYPSENYSAGYFPNDLDSIGGSAPPLSNPQFDYSGAGASGIRQYMRVFDVAFSADPVDQVQAAGQPFVLIQIHGLHLEDFVYTAPGPGRVNDPRVVKGAAIEIKVPGLTTWMDLGRADGAGPGKADAILDGAGCQVAGPYTFDTVDPLTGVVFCQVLANVGPAVNLGLGQGNEVPIMVRVRMPPEVATTLNFSAELSYDIITGDQVYTPVGPGTPSGSVRGLVKINMVRLDEPYILDSNGLAVVSTTPFAPVP